MHEFSLSFEKYKNKTAKQIDSVIRGTAIGLLGDIIYDTSVDQGRLRGNWQLSIDTEINTSVLDKDKSGEKTKQKALDYLDTHKLGKYIFIQNNLTYAETVEFGLYPKGDGSGKVTTDGYSKKSPRGMARINVARWRVKAQLS